MFGRAELASAMCSGCWDYVTSLSKKNNKGNACCWLHSHCCLFLHQFWTGSKICSSGSSATSRLYCWYFVTLARLLLLPCYYPYKKQTILYIAADNFDCELSAARYFTPSQPAGRPKTKRQLAGRPATNQAPAGRPAGRPQTKPQLDGRPAGRKPSTSWPAGRTPQTKNQLATVAPAEAKRQPASQPASQPAGQKPSPANEMNECNERND